MSQQLSLSCVRVRVQAIEGRSGPPARDVICSAEDAIAKVLRFGAVWRGDGRLALVYR